MSQVAQPKALVAPSGTVIQVNDTGAAWRDYIAASAIFIWFALLCTPMLFMGEFEASSFEDYKHFQYLGVLFAGPTLVFARRTQVFEAEFLRFYSIKGFLFLCFLHFLRSIL